MGLKMSEMRILVLYRSPSACLMHFTQDLNATYGIIQQSRSRFALLYSVGISGCYEHKFSRNQVKLLDCVMVSILRRHYWLNHPCEDF